jgi:hypothetical protein
MNFGNGRRAVEAANIVFIKADTYSLDFVVAAQFVCPQGVTPNRKALKNWAAIFLF